MKTIETKIAEQATGCHENLHGLGKFYAGPINRKGMVNDPGHELNTLEEIQAWLGEGGQVAIPNAGAGSYRRAFAAMGFPDCVTFETTSSAGDWTLVVFDGQSWAAAYQENRYPRCGFCYSVDFGRTYHSKEEAFECMADMCA